MRARESDARHEDVQDETQQNQAKKCADRLRRKYLSRLKMCSRDGKEKKKMKL